MLKKWENNGAILFRTRIIPPNAPTFPSANSYLDLCLFDKRLTIANQINNKINTLNYNSNHRALTLTVTLPHNTLVTTIIPFDKYNYMHKSKVETIH